MSNHNKGEIHDNDPSTFHILEACFTKVNERESDSSPSWFLDLGSSHHVSSDKFVFYLVKTTNGPKSPMQEVTNVTRIENVAIRLPSGEVQHINHVLYSLGV